MALDIFLGIAALSIVALTIFLIPTLIQLRQTVSELDALLRNTAQNLDPLLEELAETTRKANLILDSVEAKAAKADVLFNAAEHVGYTVEGVNSLLQQKVDSASTSIAVFSAGLKGALGYIAGSYAARKGKRNAAQGPHYY